jgi:RNA polymerase sigma factor (sigma-70 family)
MKISKKYSDAEIITAIQSGNDLNGPVQYLYTCHYDSLANFIRKNKGNPTDAEDLFQEVIVVFIDLVRQGKFRGDSSIKTYMYSIARNLWLNVLRKRNRSLLRETEFFKLAPDQDEDINAYIAKNEANKQILQIMDTLGDTCKKILVAYYYHDYSMKEILEQLDYENEQVVRNKKYKCMKQLIALLDGNESIKISLKDSLTYGI